MIVDVNKVVKQIESQLVACERTLEEAKRRINNIEDHLGKNIGELREFISKLNSSNDVRLLVDVVDKLSDIERIVDKIDSIDITPIGTNETSLERLMEDEFNEIERMVF